MELISRKNNRSLAYFFLKYHKEGRKAEFFDKEIAVTRDLEILNSLAMIVVECLSPHRDARPRMAEVARRLLELFHIHMARS